MSIDHHPGPGTYRLVPGLQLIEEERGGLVISTYPLRTLRLSVQATRLLSLCRQERSAAELAHASGLAPARVQTLCRQLVNTGLLEAGPPPPPADWPGVSIIVPTRNRAPHLERCLCALQTLAYPAERLEVIVVDDASADSTPTLLKRLQGEFTATGLRLQHIRHSRPVGAGYSRNSGTMSARYELLAYLDDDCLASPTWLRELVPLFEDPQLAAAGGLIRAYETHSLLGRYEDVRSSLFMGMQPREVGLEGPLTYLPSANLLVRRAAWERISGFASLRFGEDVDFCQRLLASGARIRYWPAALVYHNYRTDFSGFLLTRVNYASSEAVLQRLHPERRRVLVLPPEQAGAAALALGGLCQTLEGVLTLTTSADESATRRARSRRRALLPGLSLLLLALLTILGSVRRRWQHVRSRHLPLRRTQVWLATVRGHLAYTYHLCRHLTRYYTLALLGAGLLLPPLLLLSGLLYAIVSSVDYVRLRPRMSLAAFAFCSLLDDCAYEVGVVVGCLRHGHWQPLVPLLRWHIHEPEGRRA
jgi:mycofactocin system glycosyltransferase